MHKCKKTIISIALILATVLSFVSCSYIDDVIDKLNIGNNNRDTDDSHERIVPKGYTGGFESDLHFHEVYAVYWLETYDEVLEAIELLKSHGSNLTRSMAFNYEGELFDVKHCFLHKRSEAEPLAEGKNYFDRKIDGGEFVWYAFYDEVTIDELLYSCVYKYNSMYISYLHDNLHNDYYDRNFVNVENTDDLSIGWWGKEGFVLGEPLHDTPYYIVYRDSIYAELDTYYSEFWLPEEYYEEFLSTFVIIE